MGKRARYIYYMISALILCISFSYAWMLFQEKEENPKSSIDLDYDKNNGDHKLSIAAQDVIFEVGFYDEDAEDYVYRSSEEPFYLTGLVPNSVIKFRIRIVNTSAYVQKGLLGINNIKCELQPGVECDNPLEYLYISMSPAYGYTNNPKNNVTTPSGLFKKMDDFKVEKSDNTMILYEGLAIPVNNLENTETVDDYSELDCYFWLDGYAGNELQGAKITIGSFFLVI